MTNSPKFYVESKDSKGSVTRDGAIVIQFYGPQSDTASEQFDHLLDKKAKTPKTFKNILFEL